MHLQEKAREPNLMGRMSPRQFIKNFKHLQLRTTKANQLINSGTRFLAKI
jgi:hypothetical protein